ncbi:hypothetical protein BCR44DRAFT_1284214 [Catenaria anguillulae PL171]|uniref:Uncharacterized protein n=1 Tax=Catenaria anguillulae PL171 TaxID=765915 RepID=A0A1Y2HY94_9FUNG|nr:hypothetical protein BCR44DRAFT_1284214 [Catenaria anguillulae PL171]
MNHKNECTPAKNTKKPYLPAYMDTSLASPLTDASIAPTCDVLPDSIASRLVSPPPRASAGDTGSAPREWWRAVQWMRRWTGVPPRALDARRHRLPRAHSHLHPSCRHPSATTDPTWPPAP